MFKRAAAALAACTMLVGVSQADNIPHNTTKWNSLGVETISDGANTNTTNGISWLDASGDGIITVNEDVVFTVDLYKQFAGTHDFDAVKVWIEDQAVFTGQWNANEWGAWGTDALVKDSKEFTFTHAFTAIGEYDLRARVTCSNDLYQLNTDYLSSGYWWWPKINTKVTAADWEKFTPYVDLWQGELEDYKLTVVEQNVPEPTMISLLGCGLMGLLFVRRKK